MNTASGTLRLYSDKMPDSAKNLWDVPNVLLQKLPAEEFMATIKLNFKPNTKIENEKAGLVMMGLSYANLALKSQRDGIFLVYTVCKDAAKGKSETEKQIQRLSDATIYLRITVNKGAKCTFSYSTNGKDFVRIDEVFQAEPGRWIGAKMGLFCTRSVQTNDSGYADIDWFRVEPIQ